MATKAEKGLLHYEPGTAPVGIKAPAEKVTEVYVAKRDGPKPSKPLGYYYPVEKKNRDVSPKERVYRAEENARKELEEAETRKRRWTPQSAKEHDATKALDLLPKHMRVPPKEKQTEQDFESEAKRNKTPDAPFELLFRPIDPGDYNFILNAWMRSYRDCQRGVRNEDYFPGQQNLIAELAARRTIVMGCDADMPEWVVGFICGVKLSDGRLLLDYIYVKHAYRGRGIARGLLAAIGWHHGQEIVATHHSRTLQGCFLRYNAGYNPYFNVIGYSNV